MRENLHETETYGFPTGAVDSGKVAAGGVNGDWDGSMTRTLEIGKIASACSGKSNPITSQKRSRLKTASGNVSDHYEGNQSAYAIDISAKGKSGDELLSCIMKQFNGGSNSDYTGGKWLNVNKDGYRYQFGWRVAGHYDHIHIGVKKQGGKVVDPSRTKGTESKSPSSSVGLTQSFYGGKAAENIKLIINKLKQKGITNPMVQAAILATIGKESGFIPQNEIGYGSTPNSSIRNTFSSTKRLSDSDLTTLKSNDKDFFNYVYGPKGAGPGLGNIDPEDGYKYRGRGFNQITGRGNYRKYGYDSNPDELNDPDGAADAMINFLAREGSALNNKFNNQDDALEFFVTRNAGGRKTSRGESKAKEVLSRFKVGTVDGGSDSGDMDFSADKETTPGTEEKNSGTGIDMFKDFKDLLGVLSGKNKITIKEEADRIKDIIKKVL